VLEDDWPPDDEEILLDELDVAAGVLLELLRHANECAAQYASLQVLEGQSGQLLPCGQYRDVLEFDDELNELEDLIREELVDDRLLLTELA